MTFVGQVNMDIARHTPELDVQVSLPAVRSAKSFADRFTHVAVESDDVP
jgi:hypothetical protein